MNSGVPLMIAYVLLVLVGNLIAWRIGLLVEAQSPTLSLPVFLGMFFAILVVAWPLAVRATARWDDSEPEA